MPARRAGASGHRAGDALAADQHPAITSWLAPGAVAWRKAPAPLTPDRRKSFVGTLLAYEAAVGGEENR
ncbi:hypothetical protein [Streptomyces sp. NPDC058989]|uniref:hypothetical protein n=1 Tax=Streptomyces sp. NPDC058989 TaxID=3346686 RepID=UPI0036AFF5C0